MEVNLLELLATLVEVDGEYKEESILELENDKASGVDSNGSEIA